ncbi:MAG: hypothetical protein ACYSWO_15430 [Planctomycetota bacterium]|jgi:hypothetical protein
MPFNASHSEKLWKILHGVAEIHGLNMRRVDQKADPNPIVSDILEEIERAEIIVADLTGLNPNVLYEVGIAQVRCDSVVLLGKKGQSLPFNLSAIRCIFYDLDTREGQIELADRLGKTLSALKAVGPPIILNSAIDRTKTIISDLQVLRDMPDDELAEERVWFSGSLSAFAIDEEEAFRPEEYDYQKLLLEEKEALLSLARRGCSTRCIVTPPTSSLIVHRIEVMKHRLRSLVKFLTSEDKALKSIEFVVSPFRQKNLYIIGHVSSLEGYKQGTQRGYSLNLRQTELNAICGSISLYEALFNHLAAYTLVTYGTEQQDLRLALRLATLNCIDQSLKLCESLDKPK